MSNTTKAPASMTQVDTVSNMHLTLAEVKAAAEPQDFADVIEARLYHDSAYRSAVSFNYNVFMAGMKLSAFKLRAPRGTFMKTCALYFNSHRTVTRYMQIYDAVKNEFSFEIPADGEVTHSQKLKIHEVISSLRGPLRDLLNDGIRVRERQHQKYTEPKPVNIEQQLAAERADLVAGLHMVREYCLTITARGIATNAIIPPKEWDDLLNDVVPLAKMARELRRTHRRLKMR